MTQKLKKTFLVRSTTQMPVYNNQQPQIRISKITQAMIDRHHTHTLLPHQCSSINTRKINAPLPIVWSMVRQFSNPQGYKQFIKSCTMRVGDGGGIGSVREVKIISGLPAERSTERLDKLDDDMHVMMFSIIGGDHRLKNYQATTTVHEEEVDEEDDEDEDYCTVVIESYVVDTPSGNSKEDTCSFADTIIGCNLKSLARITEKMACIV